MIVISPFVADFYEEEQLTGLLAIIAVSFVVGPIGAQFNVLFQRELNFSFPVKIDFASNLISFIITVVLAYTGWGVYALVIGKVSRTFVNTSLMVFFGLQFHRPQLYFNIREVKSLISFGSFKMGERYAQILAGNWDKILIGKLLGAEQLGYYNIAYSLVIMPMFTINPIINKVMFPVFSKIKEDTKKINQYYRKGIALLMTLNVPLYIGIAIVANELVPILFGSQWIPSIPILQIASITILISSFSNPGGSIVNAKGRADISFYWSIIRSITALIFILIAYYIQPSLLSLAIGILIHRATIGSLWHLVISKIGGIDYVPILRNLLMLLAFGLAMYLAISGISYLISFSNIIVKLSVDVAVGAAIYISLLLFFDQNLREIAQGLIRKSP
jgi:PST family polysaccharide transporter/lipopolysaccharide exporter